MIRAPERLLIERKIVGLIGLARRAGKISMGDQAVRQAIKHGKADLVLVAADAGSVKKGIRSLADRAGVTVDEFSDKETLGMATGQTSKAVISIDDRHLAEELRKQLDRLKRIRGDGV